MLGDVYGLSTGLVGLSWDRKKEKEADYIGLMYMSRAGYNPEEAIKVMEGLEAEEASQPAVSAIWSTHPSNPERQYALLEAMPKALEVRRKALAETGMIVK